jgi:murein DD-endopeptidase MepM/ murein hydrolase activator NlpD
MQNLKYKRKRVKYRFNPDTLNYEIVNRNLKAKFLQGLRILVLGLFFGIMIYALYAFALDSPKVKYLKKENLVLEEQFDRINIKLKEFEGAYSSIQYLDDSLYRTIFGLDPLPKTIRQAGFGGINRYNNMEGYHSSEIMLETSKRLDLLITQMYIQEASFDEILEKVQIVNDRMKCIPAIQPIDNNNLKRIASGFGYRIHPILRIRRFHSGMDFTAQRGTNVYATGNGTIIKVKRSRRGYGNTVMIDHGYGFITVYAHLQSIHVEVGNKVNRGEVIASVGNTGFSTGPHLHYEVHLNDKPVDPVDYYFNDLTPEQYNKVLAIAKRDIISFD